LCALSCFKAYTPDHQLDAVSAGDVVIDNVY
jgi:hypothetical protein